MQKEKACCIAGPECLPNGITEEWVRKKVDSEIRRLVTYEAISCFYVGMRPGVCQWAAETVLLVKNDYPSVRLKCVLSCETLADDWTEPQRNRFYDVMEYCDEELMLQGAYTSDCERKCAKFLARRCDTFLAFWDGTEISATGLVLLYARRENCDIHLVKLILPK